MGTQKNRLNEMVLLSTQNMFKLMGKKIFTIFYLLLSISTIRGEFNKLVEFRSLIHRLEEGLTLFFNITPFYCNAFGPLFFEALSSLCL